MKASKVQKIVSFLEGIRPQCGSSRGLEKLGSILPSDRRGRKAAEFSKRIDMIYLTSYIPSYTA